ncbi:MAG TPA: NlpC/P60 family protein [Verrucomicrobiae bacterium]|nr:NlpC/P60 family protein [Verrucomicrobiae bacterium]
MKDYFSTQARVEALFAAAQRWHGTPWRANSQAQGVRGGVSCHNLPRAIYIECGALSKEFPPIVGDPNATKHKKVSVMEPMVDAMPEFRKLDMQREAMKPGDLLGLRIGHCLDHFGLLLQGNMFIHVLMHKNTDFDWINTHPWEQRLLAAWRPMEEEIAA